MLQHISRKLLLLIIGMGMAFLVISPSSTRATSSMWQEYIYNGPAGSRPYFVYTPANYQVGTAVPLVVMLHGCTQTAVDFATGTQMNQLADEYNFIVVYPQQTNNANSYACWNWYTPANQSRGGGEPAIIAGIVQEIEQATAQWTIDTQRIYVAGISAGAAMSVILGVTYPDTFAAIGVHSGLEYRAASSQGSVLRVSRRGGPNPVQQGQVAYEVMGDLARAVPTIVFQGSSDYVVRQINGDQVVQQWMQTDSLASNGAYATDFTTPTSVENGQVPGGRSYTVYKWNDSNGNEVQEYWKVNNMGHAWSGGNPSGSYSDPLGPNASLAMYTFFMSHPMPRPSVSELDGHAVSLWGKLRRVLGDLLAVKKEEE
jgi:poly(hydroxyalkanoate) depolymerase family esterase